MATGRVEIQIGDCVAEFKTKDGLRYAVVWWTDGRNPTEELPERLDKITDSECRRGKHPR